MKRLLLVRHAATSATRAAAFPADEPIEEGAAAPAARALAGFAGRGGDGVGRAAVGRRDADGHAVADGRAGDAVAPLVGAQREVVASPALRCAQTAAAAGLTPAVEPRIAECDFGAWAGRSLADLHADVPEEVAAWIGDADAAPHGGESLRRFAARVAGWLDEQAGEAGTTLAITHGGVVKAALVHALGAPLDAFWRLDVAPLTVTELHAHDGRWTVTRTNCPIELADRQPSVVGAAAAERGAVGAERGASDAERGAGGAERGGAGAEHGANAGVAV